MVLLLITQVRFAKSNSDENECWVLVIVCECFRAELSGASDCLVRICVANDPEC